MVEVTEKATLDAARQLEETAKLAESAGDLDRALGFYRGLGQIEPKNPVWEFQAVRLLRASGRGKEAAEALRQALRKFPRANTRADIKALVPELDPTDEQHRQALGDDCPPDEALKRTPIEDDGSSDVIIGRGSRKAAVIMFTGLADRMVMPLPLFDRYLSELDLTSIFLRDRKRIGFFHGVSSLGDDYESTLSKLGQMLREMGIETVHTIGNSAGGMAALSYGIDLEAETILGFSAPVSLSREAADMDRRTSVFAQRILSTVPEERRDLRARLGALKTPPKVRLYYGEEMPEDRYHAESLKGAPGVTLHGLPGLTGHGALFRMADTNGLRPLFRELYGEAD